MNSCHKGWREYMTWSTKKDCKDCDENIELILDRASFKTSIFPFWGMRKINQFPLAMSHQSQLSTDCSDFWLSVGSPISPHVRPKLSQIWTRQHVKIPSKSDKNPELRSCGPLSLTTILIEINEMIDFRIDLQINVQI